MSQKKKLMLGPLPEQDVDYSQYEETVTRWDRIIVALLLVVSVIALLVYVFAGGDEENKVSNATVKTENQSELVASADLLQKVEPVVKSIESSDLTIAKNVPETKPISTVKQEPLLKASDAVVKTSQQANSASNKQATLVSETDSVATARTEPASSTDVLSEPKLAAVDIMNPAISRAVLTQEIRNKEPGAPEPYTIMLPEEGIIKLSLFTEMQGLRGKKLIHEWYRNGVRQARVSIGVNVELQRSHSSKYINLQMTGDWQVKVTDAAKNLYVLASFSVEKP